MVKATALRNNVAIVTLPAIASIDAALASATLAVIDTPATPDAIDTSAIDAIAAMVDGPAHKYKESAGKAACNGLTFKLTALGADTATQGKGKSGKVTVMAMVCVAASRVGATRSDGVSGALIVAAMRSNPDVVAAWAETKTGKYAPAGALPCPAWCSGYVMGASRAAHGLLSK